MQNLEAKKINDEKKAALAAQFAAEATLRRVHAAQKDDDMPPIEAILAPLEAELKLARQEVLDPSVSKPAYPLCSFSFLQPMYVSFFFHCLLSSSYYSPKEFQLYK